MANMSTSEIETLETREKRLEELNTYTNDITEKTVTDLTSMMASLDLTGKIKALLLEKVEKERASILYQLLNTPRDIKKPIERPTRVENAKKKGALLIAYITEFIEKIEKLDAKEYKLYTTKTKHSSTYFVMTERGNEKIGGNFL